MIYLSRLILDPLRQPMRRDLADCNQLHRTLLRAFPQAPAGTPAREHFGLLFRTEPYERQPRLMLVLVQSTQEPNWANLRPDYLGPSPDERDNAALRTV